MSAKFYHLVILAFTLFFFPLKAATIYVSSAGDDANPGSLALPFKTINKAAQLAEPGDTVTVRAGIYRERVSPAKGGTEAKRITYQSYPGEIVIIKGSEIFTNWKKVSNNIYETEINL